MQPGQVAELGRRFVDKQPPLQVDLCGLLFPGILNEHPEQLVPTCVVRNMDRERMPHRIIRFSLEVKPPGPGIRSLTGPPLSEDLAGTAVTAEVPMIDMPCSLISIPDSSPAACLLFNEETAP